MDSPTAKRNGCKLTLAALAKAKRLPLDFLEKLGLRDLRDGGAGIPYYDPTGEEIAIKRRTAYRAKEGSYWPRGKSLAAYGQWRLHLAGKEGMLIVVEGESDCWVLWYHGLPALGVPGANAVKTLQREHVEGVDTIYVHREPDKSGETFLAGVLDRLAAFGFQGKVFELRMPDGIKDPADLHAQDPERFKARLEEAIRASTPLELPRSLERNGRAAVANWPKHERSDAWEPPIPLGEPPAPQPFPVDVLPSPLAELVEAGAAALPCPPDYLAVPLLTLAGAAMGGSRALEIKHGWRERPCLYTAVVAPPGSAKSPALKLVAAPVNAEQARRLAHYDRLKVAFEEDGDGATPKPTLSTVYVADVTTEALAVVLQDNARGVAIIRDELTAWVGALDQYRAKGRGADRQFFLSAWASEPVRVDRKNQPDGPVFVPHPFLCVVGGLPPGLLSRLRGEQALEDGFLDRILFAYPEPLPAAPETWACVPEQAAVAWAEALSFLWTLQQEQEADGGSRPRLIRLDSSGRKAWERFTQDLADELNGEGFPDCLRGPWTKMRGYCARLALIVHCLRMAAGELAEEDVNGESLNRAAQLVGYFQSHARKVYAALEADRDSEDARRVLRWIAREERTEFKRWEVHKDLRNHGRFPRLEDLDQPLERLAKHRYVRVRPPADRTGAGRPPDPVYEVNPLWDRRENRVNRINPPASPAVE